MIDHLLAAFPRLAGGHHRKTSEYDERYNCIAWAAGDTDRWWEPSPFAFWPPSVPREYSLAAYKEAFATLGYEECDSDAHEENVEKIAIFVNQAGVPTHAARLKDNGHWTSKCGKSEDIEHDLEGLTGNIYGNVAAIMKRPVQS